MKKTLYSLTLMDDLVRAVDQLAYENNTSRSNMVNRILADYLSLTTPEMYLRDLFSRIEDLLNGQSAIQVMELPSESILPLRTALDYKYRPTLRYALELTHRDSVWEGQLRIGLRSQNRPLLAHLQEFYRVFVQAERRQKAPLALPEAHYSLQGHKLVRCFALPGGMTPQTAGDAITAFLTMLDQAVKAWFDRLEDPAEGRRQVEAIYRDYLHSHKAAVL